MREQEARQLWEELGRLDRRIAKTGGLRQVRPDIRRAHRDLLAARDAADAQLQAAQEKLRSARTMVHRAESAVDENARWGRANQWRHAELDRIDRQLADHWAETVLRAVHQDEPLAYGVDRLRDARTVLAGRSGELAERNLDAIDAALARERVARVHAYAAGAPVPDHLAEQLGPMPARRIEQDTWCGLAYRIEARLDHGTPVPGASRAFTIADRLARHGAAIDPLERPRAIIASARTLVDEPHDGTNGPDRWQRAVDNAAEAHRVIEQQRSRERNHDLGLSL